MGKLIVLTGASRGIGAAIAYRLASRGYYVGCLSRSGQSPAIDAPEDVRQRWIPISADIGKKDDLQRAFEQLAAQGHQLVGLVNNAGVHDSAWATDVTVEQWNEMMSVNAFAVVTACQLVYPHLKAAGGGLIVNIGSNSDKLGVKRLLSYCASKAAVGAITRVLAVEWAVDNISVVNVAPGLILTDMSKDQWDNGPLRRYMEPRLPGKRPGKPEEVAGLVSGLFEMEAPFLTGETIYIDGGHGILV